MSLMPSHLNKFLGLVLFVCLAGCASADLSEDTGCTSDTDCGAGSYCNPLTKACEAFQTNNVNNVNNVNNSNNQNNINNLNNLNNQNNILNNLNSLTNNMVTCDPECGDNETCNNGTCVENCMPACQAPEVCTPNGCAIPDCQNIGDACDLNTQDQGEFLCLSRAGVGECFPKCETNLAASTCPNGYYCVNYGSTQAPALGCLESQCQQDSECNGGTCVNYDNGFGVCFSAGNLTEGASCDASANECEAGTICLRNMSGSDVGTCREFCDPFGPRTCPTSQVCGPMYTTREGVCSPDITTTGSEPFDICTEAGDYCADANVCLSVSDTTAGCFQWCRPNSTDCDGLMPGGDPAVCNNFVFPGERAFGICDFSCDPDDPDPCGSGVCPRTGPSANICRFTCTPGNEVQDCCDGTSPCPFTCGADNLCE